MFTASLTNVFVCALWCLGFFHLAITLGFTRRMIWRLTLFFSLGSMVFPYAGYGFSEPLVGAALLGAVVGCISFVQNKSLRPLGLASACLGIAILTKLYVFITLPILLYYVWPTLAAQPKRLLSILTAVAPLAFFLAVILYHNHLRYGSIFLTGYHLDSLSLQGGYFAFWPAQVITALYGLLFSTGRGLVFFLPLVCLFPFAYRAFKKTHPRQARLFLGLVLVHLFFFAFMIDWHAGSSWGPRYLLPIIPYVLLPLGSLVPSIAKRRILVFGVGGILAQLPGVLANPHLFVRFVLDKKIGDLAFYPGHPGDLLFSPYLSPILGGYYQIVSGCMNLLAGRSLNYTISSGTERSLSASMAQYDTLDVWWLNAIQAGLLSPAMTLGLLFFILATIVFTTYALHKLITWQRQSEGSAL